ncbi:hypothetical protein AGR4C_pb20022 [Agrobacterium tumefaciens str. Kerr 14]|uniref:Uncharacterized protein n=1 Tax=Agrobacterium tumefaciens str. Kerr 14 TaxID=1183424 RepID=A0A1S7SEG1_AGRTU|nr:hypothetical protein AGR4C_pb20022 [Agrobacterium tumefaciens str. Kerr 14]
MTIRAQQDACLRTGFLAQFQVILASRHLLGGIQLSAVHMNSFIISFIGLPGGAIKTGFCVTSTF